MKYTAKMFLFVSMTIFLASCGAKEVHFSCGISEVTQTGINHLKSLVDAMEKYKNDKGKYPEQVIDLIPSYIDKIPVVTHYADGFDNSKFDVLQSDELQASGPLIGTGGSYFVLRLYPKDDRICLFGRNNICEYTSETGRWGCYQH